MTAKQTTCRTVLAEDPALATSPAVAFASSGPQTDPIFPAIKRHLDAHRAFRSVCLVDGNMQSTDPGYAEANAATIAANNEWDNAACALADIEPTTMAGVLALLGYVDAFNRGEIGASEHHQWPEDLDDENVTTVKGRTLAMPFAFWVMRNVEKSLRKLSAN